MKNKYRYFLLLSLLLASCSNASSEKLTVKIYYVNPFLVDSEIVMPLNTTVSLTMYNENQYNECYKDFENMVLSLNKEVDRYHDYEGVNNLKTINDSYGKDNYISLSDDLFELIKLGIDLTKISRGTFNIAMGSLIDLYSDYYDGSVHELPDYEAVLASIPSYEVIDQYIELNESNKTIKLNKLEDNENKIVLSLGAIAKGFVMEKVRGYFENKGYPAIINAGSSTMATIGNKPNNKKWNVGINTPCLGNENDILCNVLLSGSYNFSTSAINEQYFIHPLKEGYEIKTHILDSSTGSSNNYHSSITYISSNCSLAILDALTTASFNIEDITDINDLIKIVEDTYNVKIEYLIANTDVKNTSSIEDLSIFDKYSITVSSEFDKYASGIYSSKVINKKVK